MLQNPDKTKDAAGDFSPLADFTMHGVLQLGKVLKLPDIEGLSS